MTIETLAAVVDQLAASGLFHAALYERGFLTSKRIQDVYKRQIFDRYGGDCIVFDRYGGRGFVPDRYDGRGK